MYSSLIKNQAEALLLLRLLTSFTACSMPMINLKANIQDYDCLLCLLILPIRGRFLSSIPPIEHHDIKIHSASNVLCYKLQNGIRDRWAAILLRQEHGRLPGVGSHQFMLLLKDFR